MAIRNLIVLVDDSKGCAARIETALFMARKYGAHLTGVLAQEMTLLTGEEIRGLSKTAQDLAAEHVGKMEEEAGLEIKQLFYEQVARAKWKEKASWRMIHGNPDQVATVISRYADLVLAGQEEKPHQENKIVDPGKVVSISGRPMFVVPQKFKHKELTEHVVLGWNGSREAARAISDSMQILETKTLITILTFRPAAEMPENYGFDIGAHIRRHGLATKHVQFESRSGKFGWDIVNYASKVNADLIVMGAYTRSRLTEAIFGGATRSVLKHMITPVFLSH